MSETAPAIPSIGAFVQGHIDRTGDSFRSLHKRSGDQVHHSTWERMAKNTIKEFPEPGTVRQIAQTLCLSETLVVLSIAKTLGLEVSLSAGPSIPIPSAAGALDERQRRVIWDMILAFLPPREESRD